MGAAAHASVLATEHTTRDTQTAFDQYIELVQLRYKHSKRYRTQLLTEMETQHDNHHRRTPQEPGTEPREPRELAGDRNNVR